MVGYRNNVIEYSVSSVFTTIEENMAHGERAAAKANSHKEYGSKRLPGYQPKGKYSKKLTHKKERLTGKRSLSSNGRAAV